MANPTNQPQFKVKTLRNVRVPMRDGVELAADFYCPDAPGRFPTLVERTPYNREESVLHRTKTPDYFASRGYLLVIQDVRGRYGSDGVWYPFVADGWGVQRDGLDTIEWLARHPLSNGKVGTVGGSFAGMTQMLVAPTRPRHLVASFVRESASDLAEQWVYRGGAFELGFNLEWNLRHALPTLAKQVGVVKAALERKPALYVEDPLLKHAAIADPHAWLRDCLSHPDDDGFYEPFDIDSQHAEIDTPMMHFGGWFDIFLGGTLANFNGLRKHARTAKARRAQRLVIGPWMHGPTLNDPAFDRFVGEMDFGPDALLDLNREMLQWFDYWLRSEPNGVMDSPPVRYFLMGANRWCTAESWPPSESKPLRLYFTRGTGRTERSLNNGRLTREKPTGSQAADSFVYDPRDPVPSIGGNTLHSPPLPAGRSGPLVADFMAAAGPRDQSSTEGRCLTYTTEPLAEDLQVVGPVRVILHASSSAPDTDFVARLCDVFPDGRSIQVADGILRARYRQSRSRPRPLEPGRVYELNIDLWSTAWLFPTGHRLRVSITSSCFPRFDRNPNTGRTMAESATMRSATNRVFHDSKHPSHIVLSVMNPR
jgi:putative CocE/NonD family hydrolase